MGSNIYDMAGAAINRRDARNKGKGAILANILGQVLATKMADNDEKQAGIAANKTSTGEPADVFNRRFSNIDKSSDSTSARGASVSQPMKTVDPQSASAAGSVSDAVNVNQAQVEAANAAAQPDLPPDTVGNLPENYAGSSLSDKRSKKKLKKVKGKDIYDLKEFDD